MSFILDALRKSEHERQDRIGPDLAHVRVARERDGVPRWVIVLGALLLLNLAALLIMSLWDRDVPEHEQAASPSASAPAEPAPFLAPPAARPASQRQQEPTAATPPASSDTRGEVRPLRNEAVPREPPTPKQTATAARQPAPGRVIYEQTAIDRDDSTAARVTPARGTEELADSAAIQSLNDARASGLDIPDINVEIHVYDATAANRFVFINMSKYGEGDRLKEGPVIEQITPDGVILRHQSQRFIVPRN
jgi:general secretion pathway protein B